MRNEIEEQARGAVTEFLDAVTLRPGDILVVGCSSSEICGKKIGSGSSEETANAVFGAIYPILKDRGIYLAAQCCEHLNRAIVLEKEAAEKYGLPIVNAVPQPKAGGSFATAAYRAFQHPAAVESVQANAGMDIGDTLIGMHLRPVAVPVRLNVKKIGEANLVCARTRPKYIGGERAHYDPELG
ncbi:TIGR01440 family protein [Caproiciproducens sp. NJN-50]|uniref:TIGR01440 family protein n=1 Tax=Acutalibacteraceae TaxID=3082771 RepID=UPI000FFE2BDC|nr:MULTISPECIES: TIGR01440 family protein [Acutalibacteraceae]QAT51034.1 TIGR01440 family protein [Caproiciproducens sp. NJN-50]